MSRIDSALDSPVARNAGATVLRVTLGGVFVAHALAKPLVFTFPGAIQFFEAFGFPGWTVYLVFAAELLGGLALLVGFRTRLAALGLVPVMLGALKPHLGNGWMFTGAGGGWEYVAVLIAALVTQVLLGSGLFALDGVRGRRASPSRREEPLAT